MAGDLRDQLPDLPPSRLVEEVRRKVAEQSKIREPYGFDARYLDATECRECGGYGRVLDGDHEVMPCEGCKGSGDARDHKDWCDRCGMSGRCPDCDPPDPHDR